MFLDLDITRLILRNNCEQKVIEEILEKQNDLPQQAVKTEIRPKNDLKNFEHYVEKANLSVRTTNVLLKNVKSIQELIEIDERRLLSFRNCGMKVVREVFDFKETVLQDLFGYVPPEEPERTLSLLPEYLRQDQQFYESIKQLLCIRAQKVLVENEVDTLDKFMAMTRVSMLRMPNCGSKTVAEIDSCQRKMYELALNICKEDDLDPVHIRNHVYDFFGDMEVTLSSLPESIRQDTLLYETIQQSLCKRGQYLLVQKEIDTLEKFMTLTSSSISQVRNCGNKTISEIVSYQRKVYDLAQKIMEEEGSGSALIDTGNYVLAFSENDEVVDVDTPFPSLERWVAQIGKMSERNQRAFMLRMGMLGRPRMILEQIGQNLQGITRERVRQVIGKMERRGRHHVYKKKVQPLIETALDIVRSKGGKVRKTTLVSLLLAHGPDGDMLKHADPFIDFLGTLTPWKDMGLGIDANDVVFIEKSDEIIKQVSLEIVTIAKENADEIIDEHLWSIDYDFFKKRLFDWLDDRYPDEKIVMFSETVFKTVFSLCQTHLIKGRTRVYSYHLWMLRHGSLLNAAEAVLSMSGRAMHFSEVFHELRRYRTEALTENSVHSSLYRDENVFLWDRGMFIHKKCTSIPPDLIKEMEEWILEKLKDVPFIGIYGPFNFFQERCLESGITGEMALYSVLKDSNHPLVTYPRVPYIYFGQVKARRVPVPLVLEQFLRDAGRVVSHGELKAFVFEKLYLKDFQFNMFKNNIPNTTRTPEFGFLHADFLGVDDRKFGEIVAYLRNILVKEGHVSAGTIFNDKKFSCKIIGINNSQSLFSMLKAKLGHEFDLESYPQIRLLSSDTRDGKKARANKVVISIKGKNVQMVIKN